MKKHNKNINNKKQLSKLKNKKTLILLILLIIGLVTIIFISKNNMNEQYSIGQNIRKEEIEKKIQKN